MQLSMKERGTTTRQSLKSLWQASPPSRFLDYKDFLRHLQRAVESQYGRYPYHQYAKDLGLSSHNAIYVIIHGYRKLNREQADIIITKLGLNKAERRYFLKLIEYTDCQDEKSRQELFQELVAIKEQAGLSERDRLLLRFFKDWHHAAIFELVDLADFQSNPDWIASRFYKRLSPDSVSKSLVLLEQLDLIRYDHERGKHVKKNPSLSTGDEVKGLAVVGYHLQMLEMAQSAMWQVPATEREFGALTLSVNEELAKRLREDARFFRRYAMFLSEQCQAPDRIVQVNLQVFPMTRAPDDQ